MESWGCLWWGWSWGSLFRQPLAISISLFLPCPGVFTHLLCFQPYQGQCGSLAKTEIHGGSQFSPSKHGRAALCFPFLVRKSPSGGISLWQRHTRLCANISSACHLYLSYMGRETPFCSDPVICFLFLCLTVTANPKNRQGDENAEYRSSCVTRNC